MVDIFWGMKQTTLKFAIIANIEHIYGFVLSSYDLIGFCCMMKCI